jgi:hypothetical protein
LEQDYVEAGLFFESASSFGNGNARYELGRIYENGWRVNADYSRAKRLYHEALHLGCFEASKRIGILFLKAPEGVSFDLERARKHLLIYEEHFESDAETHIALGHCDRLTSRTRNAKERYLKATDLTEERKAGRGCYWVGYLLENNHPVSKSDAVKWYKHGSTLRDSKSMWRLGQLHVSGQHVKKDINAARILFADAAMLGSEDAKNELDKLDAEIAKQKMVDKETAKQVNRPNKTIVNPVKESKKEETKADNELVKAPSKSNNEALTQVEVNKIETQLVDDQLIKIIQKPKGHRNPVTNDRIRYMVNDTCKNALKNPLHNCSDTRGYKFKTKTDIRKQFKKAESRSPPTQLEKLEFTNLALQSSQNYIKSGLETTNTFLFKNIIHLTSKISRITLENEKSTNVINHNNQEIEKKFQEIETLIDNGYNDVCQRLEKLEQELLKKDETIELLIAKLNSQSQQFEKLMRLVDD